MRIAVLREDLSAAPRVAATTESDTTFAAAGASVVVQAGAGSAAGISDEQYRNAGAVIAGPGEAGRDADLILKVRRPESVDGIRPGAAIVALMDPYGNEAALRRLANAGLAAFSLELI